MSAAPLKAWRLELLAQRDGQARSVDQKTAVVSDEAQFLELIHEKSDAGPRRANHLRQHFLRCFGQHL